MTRNDEERIADIVEACDELAVLVAPGKEKFDADRTLQLAIERLLEIIGEASNALADETRARLGDVDWPGITRLRIVLAHHYHRVDHDLVWAMATTEVPELQRRLAVGGS